MLAIASIKYNTLHVNTGMELMPVEDRSNQDTVDLSIPADFLLDTLKHIISKGLDQPFEKQTLANLKDY